MLALHSSELQIHCNERKSSAVIKGHLLEKGCKANDTVVYQTYVYAGTQMVSLPTTLSGSYTLQLSDDTFVFTGNMTF